MNLGTRLIGDRGCCQPPESDELYQLVVDRRVFSAKIWFRFGSTRKIQEKLGLSGDFEAEPLKIGRQFDTIRRLNTFSNSSSSL